jgi:hypothetical protein
MFIDESKKELEEGPLWMDVSLHPPWCPAKEAGWAEPQSYRLGDPVLVHRQQPSTKPCAGETVSTRKGIFFGVTYSVSWQCSSLKQML